MDRFLLIVKPKLPEPWDRLQSVYGWQCGIPTRIRIKALKVFVLWCYPPKEVA